MEPAICQKNWVPATVTVASREYNSCKESLTRFIMYILTLVEQSVYPIDGLTYLASQRRLPLHKRETRRETRRISTAGLNLGFRGKFQNILATSTVIIVFFSQKITESDLYEKQTSKQR